MRYYFLREIFIAALLCVTPAIASAGAIINGNDIAQFTQQTLVGVGIEDINFDTTEAPSDLSTAGLSGHAWSTAAGWMQFQGNEYGVGVSCNSSGIGTLTGNGWGDTAGYINFDPVNGGVSVDVDGILDGYAWSQNYGWIHFDQTQCPGGEGCVQYDFSCPISTPPDDNDDGGGGGISSWCSLSSSNTSINSEESTDITITLGGLADTIVLQGITYQNDDSIVVSPNTTTTYIGKTNTNKTCSLTIGVDGEPPVEGPTCQDAEAINYDPAGTEHNQDLCEYFFGACFIEIDEVCETAPDVDNENSLLDDAYFTFDSSTQCPYFETNLRRGDRGYEVAKVQDFMNRYLGQDLLVDGIYGRDTAQAVGALQLLHAEDILAPWRYIRPTRRWYKTTRATANGLVGCQIGEQYLEDVGETYIFDNQNIFGIVSGVVSTVLNWVGL